MKYPKINTEVILATVKSNPDFPACMASLKFKPKPNPTIDICKSKWMYLWVNFSNGFPNKTAKIIPIKSEIGELVKGVKQNITFNICYFFIIYLSHNFLIYMIKFLKIA